MRICMAASAWPQYGRNSDNLLMWYVGNSINVAFATLSAQNKVVVLQYVNKARAAAAHLRHSAARSPLLAAPLAAAAAGRRSACAWRRSQARCNL